MKKLFVKLTACVVVTGATFAVAYVSYLQNVANLPNILSANVEALAKIELPEIVVTACDNNIIPSDDGIVFDCDTCDYLVGWDTDGEFDGSVC